MKTMLRSLFATLLFCTLSLSATAKEITVMISGGFKPALQKLIPQFEAKTGDTIVVVAGPSMGKTPQAIPARLARGEAADVVIMVGDALTTLSKEGWIAPGSRVELADSPIGMVVKEGDAVPAIKTNEELRATLLKAKSIAYSDSASGVYVSSQLFKKLGIDEAVAQKAQKVERIPVAGEVAKGHYAVGFQQVSELLPEHDVTFLGELPADLQYITRFAGAVTAKAQHAQEGKALLAFLSAPEAQSTIHLTGMHSVAAAPRDTAR